MSFRRREVLLELERERLVYFLRGSSRSPLVEDLDMVLVFLERETFVEEFLQLLGVFILGSNLESVRGSISLGLGEGLVLVMV